MLSGEMKGRCELLILLGIQLMHDETRQLAESGILAVYYYDWHWQ